MVQFSIGTDRTLNLPYKSVQFELEKLHEMKKIQKQEIKSGRKEEKLEKVLKVLPFYRLWLQLLRSE